MDTAAYLIGDQRIAADAPGFAEAITAAHEQRIRPRCLCLAGGIEMYVARLGDGFLVKRMPNTGSDHAQDCPSYEPPPELSGLGQVLGTAIKEDAVTGETTLKLGFSMSRLPSRCSQPPQPGDGDSVHTDGTKLSLRGLLHYLWDQAGLTRWHPGFAGRRTWSTVRRHLLQAAQHKIARGIPLAARLYVPEAFSVEQRDSINARRLAQWRHAIESPGKTQQLMLLIGEVKEIVPARYGHKAKIKHVPDQAFALDEQLFRRLGRRFESDLSLWSATDCIRMVMIATFGVSASGVPTLAELSLMPVTTLWLPVENGFEVQLLERLLQDGRTFVKGLRYNMPPSECVASVVLTDTANSPCALWVATRGAEAGSGRLAVQQLRDAVGEPVWEWRTADGAMPPLPSRFGNHSWSGGC
jgi:hypothetical protein